VDRPFSPTPPRVVFGPTRGSHHRHLDHTSQAYATNCAAQSRRRKFTASSPGICAYPALIRQTIHIWSRIRLRAASHSRSAARNIDFTAWQNARRRVSRVLYRRRTATDPAGGDGHSSRTPVAERLMRPTRAAARRCARRLVRGTGPRAAAPAAPTWSCSRWGFPCRRRCRQRGALLPHHFTLAARPVAWTSSAVCFLWHCPWGRPRRALPGTVPSWSPDFPLPASRRAAVRPSGERRCGQWR
jgi:hypothetical protein